MPSSRETLAFGWTGAFLALYPPSVPLQSTVRSQSA